MQDDGDASPSPLTVSALNTIASGLQPSDDCPRLLKPFPSSASTAIIPARTPRFELPSDWEVKEVPRPVGNHIDKYYFHPGSSKKFRSLKEVERYVSGQEYAPPEKPEKPYKHISKSGSKKMVVSGGMLLKLDEVSDREQLTIASPFSAAGTSNFALPDGWVVKEVSSKYHGHTTKYYYEPGTGRRFQSISAVKKYVSEKNIENAPLAKMFKLGNNAKKSGSRKRTSVHKIDGSTSDLSRKHIKINWVLDDSGKGKWDAFIGESIIPESIRKLWDEKFKSSIHGNDA